MKIFNLIRRSLKSSYLVAMMFLGVIGCQEEGLVTEQDLVSVDEEYKDNLSKATIFFGKVFKDKEAQIELLGFSQIEGNDGEISQNLKQLFVDEQNARKKSAIVRRVYNLTHSSAKTSVNDEWDYDDFNYEDFLTFISENDISLIAPYLAENFHVKDLDQGLTVSYYTDDMNQDVNDIALHKTPGYLISFSDQTPTLAPVEVNDDYAYSNPTIVLGKFPYSGPTYGTGGVQGSQSSNITCPELLPTDILTLKMPHFKLNGNIAGWPRGNHIHLWIAYGEFTANAAGNPQLSSKTPQILDGKKVSRRNARKGTWISSDVSHLIQNWKIESSDFFVIWGYEKNKEKVEVSMEVSSTGSSKATSKITSEEGIKLHTSIAFDKCAVLLNNKSNYDDGYGLIDSKNTIYRSNQVSMYFTTVHRR